MNQSLSHELGLPIIGGTISAYFVVNSGLVEKEFRKAYPKIAKKLLFKWQIEASSAYRKFALSDRRFYETGWSIGFYSDGPDLRYNAGSRYVWAEDFRSFFNSLKLAKKELISLKDKTFLGEYRKKIDESSGKFLEMMPRTANRIFGSGMPAKLNDFLLN